ncbi:hypothetical protein BJX63DRAFT_55608 [Aspergillus granulosus]|uniref:Uncharacterized protein n=1 Tax=Aspergillus granulosus TaxID=176169 RepID=A0ABR4GXV0_9EURO
MTSNARKTVLITGCSAGGAGSALAETFHSRGLHVFATAPSVSKMSHLEKKENITLLQLDVEDPEPISVAVQAVEKHTGGTLDYLVNNAGMSWCVRRWIRILRRRGRFSSHFKGCASIYNQHPIALKSKVLRSIKNRFSSRSVPL